jgi:hypothetical protein
MRDILSKLDALLNETALNPNDPKGDYEAKKKALYDLETDPIVNKDPEMSKAVSQRKLDLEKEAKSKGIKESTDHEARMAKAELIQIAKNAKIIFERINNGDELQGWVSSYITLANDHLNSVAEYIEYNPPEQQ